MSGLTCILVALAAWQTVEIWRHSEMAPVVWLRDEFADCELWPGPLSRCPFCLSVWVAGGWSAWEIWTCDWCPWAHLLLYALALSRIANLANDLTHTWSRTPKADRVDLPQDVDKEERSGPWLH